MMFFRSRRGVVTVEFALLLPTLLAIAAFSTEAIRAGRAESRLHRATAILADAIANQHLDSGVPLVDALPDSVAPALEMLGAMLGEEDFSRIGVTVTYADTLTAGDPRMTTPVYTAGLAPGASGAPAMRDLASSGLVAPINNAKAELVLVECVYDMPQEMFVFGLLHTDPFTSYFVTLRKQWR